MFSSCSCTAEIRGSSSLAWELEMPVHFCVAELLKRRLKARVVLQSVWCLVVVLALLLCACLC